MLQFFVRIISKKVKRSHLPFCEERVEYELIDGNTETGVIIIPPSSLWPGGNMYLDLITRIFKKCIDKNIAVMRFTFPSIELYDNEYNRYIYYTSLCIDEFLQNISPIKKFVLVGYSFGALLSLNLFLRRPEVDSFVMISPALTYYDHVSWLNHNKSDGLIIYGRYDPFIPVVNLNKYVSLLEEKEIKVKLLDLDSDHSMKGHEEKIASEIIRYVETLEVPVESRGDGLLNE